MGGCFSTNKAIGYVINWHILEHHHCIMMYWYVKIFLIFFYILLIYWEKRHAMVYKWRPEDSLWELVLSLHTSSPREQHRSWGLAATAFTLCATSMPQSGPSYLSVSEHYVSNLLPLIELLESTLHYFILLPMVGRLQQMTPFRKHVQPFSLVRQSSCFSLVSCHQVFRWSKENKNPTNLIDSVGIQTCSMKLVRSESLD